MFKDISTKHALALRMCLNESTIKWCHIKFIQSDKPRV